MQRRAAPGVLDVYLGRESGERQHPLECVQRNEWGARIVEEQVEVRPAHLALQGTPDFIRVFVQVGSCYGELDRLHEVCSHLPP